jgi:hypothetical protein
MIAIVVDEYEQAVRYLGLAAPLDPAYVVVAAVEHVPDELTGAAFLGGSTAVRARVGEALARAPQTAAPKPRDAAATP